MGEKSKATKKRLATLQDQNTRIQAWVVAKTDGEVGRDDPDRPTNPKRRDWRRDDTGE